MKLASLKNGRPDGQLVVVSADLGRFVSAGKIAATLQAALDDWEIAAPKLGELSNQLNRGEIAGLKFEAAQAAAPLPRAFQWVDGNCYLAANRGAAGQMPLRIYQGASDSLLGPRDQIEVPSDDLSLDIEGEFAVITGPVPMKPSKAEASVAIRLITFCNDVSLRRLVADDLQNGYGYFHAKPATAFAPIVATPDEFGDAWQDNRLHLRMQVMVNDMLIGRPDGGIDMQFDFADLVVAAAKTRKLGCGTILGAGAVANVHEEVLPIKRDGIGFASLVEARTAEKLKFGAARTPFLKAGDRVRLSARDGDERAVLGEIDQRVVLV